LKKITFDKYDSATGITKELGSIGLLQSDSWQDKE
jgi:hypothetical protein